MGWKQLDQIALDMSTLFDDIEEEVLKAKDSDIEKVITVGEHTRVRRPKEQHFSYDHLLKVDEYLSVPVGEDICEKCDSKIHIKKYQTKELVYESARLFVRVTHIPVLECENCQIYSEEGKLTYHTVIHHFLFDRSICSPELLAYIIDMKYNNGLPLYTIDKIFQRDHAIIPRQNMSN